LEIGGPSIAPNAVEIRRFVSIASSHDA